MTISLNKQLATRDFESARRKAFWRELISWLTRKCNQLLAIDQICQKLLFKGQHYRGLQTVPLEKIVGSEHRYRDFDRAFYPRQSHTRKRWVSIDQAYYEQVPLPPVELLKVGERYFVRDGNHRVSVARAQGQNFMDAYVTELSGMIPIEHAQKC
jgi:hypothetical protein